MSGRSRPSTGGHHPGVRTALVLGSTAVAALLMAPAAGAHTGHGTDGAVAGLLHPLTGVDHLVAIVAVGLLAATAWRGRMVWSVPAGFVGGMLAGALLGMAGAAVPGVEVAIAASVLLLGLLVGVPGGLPDRGAGRWVTLLAALLGAVHGHAHGAELPASAAPWQYVAGFVAATVVLHLLGAALGVAVRRSSPARVAASSAISAVGIVLLVGG